MTENELQRKTEILAKKMMEDTADTPLDVVFNATAYMVALCIHCVPDVSPTKLLQNFNDRVVDMHRAIAESDDEGGGEHTLQ